MTTVLPDLSARINQADAATQRRVALAVVEYGLSQVPVRVEGLDQALATLRTGQTGDETLRQSIQAAADAADERYFAAQDAGDEAAESRLFKEARMLTAVADALGIDPRAAAQQAAYEVQATQDGDLSGITSAIQTALVGDQ
ncbi:hypothetical protein [Fodinicola acaciae]|uniref:hypothetical protein n=1 Tax=Fodinicola acaciae TaxID=2681555 RepID=UPI0013D8DC76|nr:hypothetical protein [Fodinicola acaciae]